MFPRWFRRQVPPPPPPLSLDQEARERGARFAQWAAGQGLTEHGGELLDRVLATLPREPEPSEGLLADAAAFLGEQVRAAHGGEWGESPLFGVVLAGVGGLPLAVFRPLDAVEHAIRTPGGVSLSAFVAKLTERLASEMQHREYLSAPGPGAEELLSALREGGGPEAAAVQGTAAFRQFCQGRFGGDLPLTLRSVRELDRWLRSHYFLYALREETLWQAGFFLGEVMRGLFGGEWRFDAARPDGVSLVWPEIALHPVGRIFKMLQECPAGEPLDEYARMVPSARKAAGTPPA